MLESQIEVEILNWLNLKGFFAWKVNNRAAFDGKKYVSMSKFQLRGQPDITCLVKNGPVIFFEVKKENGRQSESQKTFEKRVKMFGHHYYLVKSVEEVKNVIESVSTREHSPARI